MIFGSVCSGIDAASVAWLPLGWRAAWFSEIEAFPSAVLAHHYPDVVNLGDMTLIADKIVSGEVAAPDILVGGTPCQAFSVAGARKGLADDRGQLTIKYAELLDAIDAVRVSEGKSESIAIWENVPGVLSDKENAFGCFLGIISGESEAFLPPGGRWKSVGCVLGAKRAIAWRVLDAQYFGVAQRRRRVFLVASARKDFDPTKILFEREGVRRNIAPSRESGKEIAGTLASRTGGDGFPGTDESLSGHVQPVASALKARHGSTHREDSDTFVATSRTFESCQSDSVVNALDTECGFTKATHQTINQGHLLVMSVHGTQDPDICIEHTHPLGRNQGQENAIAYGLPGNWIGREPKNGGNATQPMIDVAPCQTKPDVHGVAYGWSEELNALRDLQPTIQRGGAGGRHEGVAYATVASFKGGQGASAGGIGYCEHTSPTLTSADSGSNRTPVLLQRMAVRRLTPVECERLQGFPSVQETLRIDVCCDHQTQNARVELKCLRSQSNAWPAEGKLSMPYAKTAAVDSSINLANLEPHVALHVRMRSEDELLEIRSQGKLIWYASGVESQRKSAPPTLPAITVQQIARLLRDLVKTVPPGKVASLPSIRLSMRGANGSTSAEKYTPEIKGFVADAMSGQKRGADTFTTSSLGRDTAIYDSIAETFCCSVLHAIDGFIPSITTTSSFSVEVIVETPYTQIPWRNKPIDECPDGGRYKALGNSMAVPCMAWIGKRVADYLEKYEL